MPSDKGFMKKRRVSFEEFYLNGLRGNPALEKACEMGMIEIRGARILSGLNNRVIYASDKK